jgi:molecular chaperone GrpE
MAKPKSQHELQPTGEEPSASASAATDLALELEGLRAEMQDANERVLRSQAEFENYRKRVQREMAEDRKYAALPLVLDMLAVADNLDRAIEAAEKDAAASGLLEGVRMVVGQFNAVLAQHHCTRIEGVGQPFDPHLHEALAQEPSTEYPAGTISRVIRYGYQLHDRVVRPTQVFVSSGPPAS